jgi:hypothetical protein
MSEMAMVCLTKQNLLEVFNKTDNCLFEQNYTAIIAQAFLRF